MIRNVRRVVVLSDVHGNATALAAVLAELATEEIDLVVFGGDLTWGSEPEATLALAEGLDMPVVMIRGNAERQLASGTAETEREAWMLAHHRVCPSSSSRR